MTPRFRTSISQQGFSLVELLVAILVSLLASLAIFGVLSTYEGKKRATTFVNDAVISGNFGMFYMDGLIRAAGSGFAQAWQTDYGCPLKAYNSASSVNTGIFPTHALSPDFTKVQTDSGGNFVLAPVLIDYQGSAETDGAGHTSDAIVVMSGNAGNAEFPTTFTAVPPTGAAIPLVNTVPFLPGDLLLLADASGGTQAPCMMTQVSSTYLQSSAGGATVTPLPLAGGTFYQNPIGTTAITGYSKVAQAIDLGNPTSDTPPVFSVLGVNANHVLVDYQMLNNTGVSNQVADGVFEMHALYGVDTTGTGQISAWVSPSAAPWDFATLSQQLPGNKVTGTGAYAIERIKAIRVGLILRTDIPENTKTPNVPVTAGPIQLFTDLTGLTYTRPLTLAETGYRYRTVEETIPIRNNILIAQ